MTICYGIYYYTEIYHRPADVKLVYLSTDLNKIKKFIEDNFTYVRKGINNSINMAYNDKRCVGWVSTYEMDEFLPDQGLTCNQPRNSIDIQKLCENVGDEMVYKIRKLDYNDILNNDYP